ncbi:MAG: hypothetical protein V2A71_02610, partial [Candidatus Eisenbacteria bacterium]
ATANPTETIPTDTKKPLRRARLVINAWPDRLIITNAARRTAFPGRAGTMSLAAASILLAA